MTRVLGRPASRAVEVDAELRRRAVHLERDYLAFAALLEEFTREGWFVRYGCPDVETYLERELHLRYRSVRRRLKVVETVKALPDGEQPAAMEALAKLGAHRAEIVSAAIKRDPDGWRDWAKIAASETVQGLQARVSRTTGAKPRGRTADASAGPPAAGARFLAYVLNQVPPDERELVEAVFAIGQRLAKTDNAVAVFLNLCREARVEWEARLAAGVD